MVHHHTDNFCETEIHFNREKTCEVKKKEEMKGHYKTKKAKESRYSTFRVASGKGFGTRDLHTAVCWLCMLGSPGRMSLMYLNRWHPIQRKTQYASRLYPASCRHYPASCRLYPASNRHLDQGALTSVATDDDVIEGGVSLDISQRLRLRKPRAKIFFDCLE